MYPTMPSSPRFRASKIRLMERVFIAQRPGMLPNSPCVTIIPTAEADYEPEKRFFSRDGPLLNGSGQSAPNVFRGVPRPISSGKNLQKGLAKPIIRLYSLPRFDKRC